MKIIELKGDIYDVLSDGVAGENCIVKSIMVQLMYLATWKEYTTSKLYKLEVLGEICNTRRVILQRILTRYGGTKPFSILIRKRVQDFKNQGFR
jgi:hypothetical protein